MFAGPFVRSSYRAEEALLARRPRARSGRALVAAGADARRRRALSGLLFALAFPPFGCVVLLPLALVPWLVALAREESRTRALLSGALFGLAYWCLSIRWITFVVTQYGGQSGVMGIVCLGILAAILAEWPALVAWGTVAAAPPGSAARLAVFPLLWAATEHARSFVYKGFPWNLTGHALFRDPVWLQSASVWGVYGLGLAVAAVAALLAPGDRRAASPPPALAAALVRRGARRLRGDPPGAPRAGGRRSALGGPAAAQHHRADALDAREDAPGSTPS